MAKNHPTILTIDDNAGLTGLYEAWLADEYTVVTAYNGKEGLEKLTGNVEVVILDRDMPEMSGDEFLQRCRQQGWDCRVLVVTATEPDGDVLELGFDAYLCKPIERETLLDYVSMMLRRQRYSDKIKEYFATVSKIALLDVDTIDNGNREKYERLVERRKALRDRIDQALDGFERRDFEAEYHRLTEVSAAD